MKKAVDIDNEMKAELIRRAIGAQKYSFAPYSRYNVGAAALFDSGEIYTGVNVESASFSGTICAERNAIFSAVAKGLTKYRAIAVSGGMKGQAPADYCMPCGMCLQVMSEFCDPSFKVYIVKGREEVLQYQLRDLLPETFKSLPI